MAKQPWKPTPVLVHALVEARQGQGIACGSRSGLATSLMAHVNCQGCLAELTGNFNGIIDPKTGQQVVVKNPLTGQAFFNNEIPSNLLDSVGANLASFYPHINGTSPTAQYIGTGTLSVV